MNLDLVKALFPPFMPSAGNLVSHGLAPWSLRFLGYTALLLPFSNDPPGLSWGEFRALG